ncbi:IclR family transcriptional regulator [Chachezhania sediminis]|uniref:IclR family transcriptional regulator n=1 Tax=Chachezhania sediminis TaxID=2599291 RepID=UPI00131A61A4|nr:IclR family transcriptional regulator [Chachezhania sediminis]
MTKDTSTRRGIQSVEIGMRVLKSVARMSGPSTLTGIAQAAGLSSSQTHRYLSSLIVSGMVAQDPHSGLYDLASGAIHLGLAALGRIDAFATAEQHMKSLVLQTGRTGLVTVWGDAGATVIRLIPGVPRVVTNLAVGTTLPLLTSANGMIHFAFGDPAEMDAQAAVIAAGDPDMAPKDPQALRNAILSEGFAAVSGDFIPGLRAVAAPVLDAQGDLVLTASLIASRAFRKTGDSEATRNLIETASTISEAIGYRAGPAATPT